MHVKIRKSIISFLSKNDETKGNQIKCPQRIKQVGVNNILTGNQQVIY